MPWSLPLLAAILLMACHLCHSETVAVYAPTPASIYGDVQVTMPQGAKRPLKLEDYLPIGAMIETGDDGELLLAVQPSMAVMLGHHTRAYVSQWKRAAPVDAAEKRSPSDPVTAPEATIVLLHGNLYGLVEKGAGIAPILHVQTSLGRFRCQGGCFALFHYGKTAQATTLFGDLNIDTRFDLQAPDETFQYDLEAGRSLAIPKTGEIQSRDPVSQKFSPLSMHYVDEEEGANVLSIIANSLMEAVSDHLLDQESLHTLANSLSYEVKAGRLQEQYLQPIGLQLTSMLLTKRVNSWVAQLYINEFQKAGLNIPLEISREIHQAMFPPPSTHPSVATDPVQPSSR